MAISAMPASEAASASEAGRQPAWLSNDLRASYETLLQRIAWPGRDHASLLRTLGVTSSTSTEGVSTVAAQLAATAAGGQHRVLLVDANLGRPRVHRIFDLPRSPGLADVLVSPSHAAEAIRPSAFGSLSVLCAGEVSAKALVDVGQLSDALEAVRAGYDLVVFDLPAAGESSFAVCVAGMLDGVILVVEAERIRWEAADRAKHRLLGAKAQLLGTVLNKRRQYGPAWMNRNP